MSISAAIIVKNEEKIISRCLDCVSMFADEIVVVDTGSTDRTKEIIAARGNVRLFDSEKFSKDTAPEDFEFGVAKNEAIRRCTGDWVIWWDADDVIDSASADRIRKLSQETQEPRLYSFLILYGPMRFEHVRMFRNGAGIYFDEHHACHEYLNANFHPVISRREIQILHLPEWKAMPSNERNLKILEKDCFVRGRADQRNLFYLANAYREHGRNQEAADTYAKYLELSTWREERFFARYYRGLCLMRIGKLDEAREQLLLSLNEDFRFGESYCLLGDIAAFRGDKERAVLWYRMAMATPIPQDARLFVSTHLYSEYPAGKISECLASQPEPTPKPAEPKTKEVEKVYGLPEDRSLAMFAATALSNCARFANEKVYVAIQDEWQRHMVGSFDTLVACKGDGSRLSLPENMKGRHAIDWYIRSAGFLIPNPQPVSVVIRKNAGGKTLLFEKDLIPGTRVAELSGEVVDDKAGFKDAVEALGKAKAFIGTEGWLRHVAYWMGIPTLVFWKGEVKLELAYAEQDNLTSDEAEKRIAEFLKKTAVAQV